MIDLQASDQAMSRRPHIRALLAEPPLGAYTLPILFAIAGLILAAIPLGPQLFGAGMDKDYPRWYEIGQVVLSGGDLHAVDMKTAFEFLYPPFAAVLIAPLCLFGPAVMILG
ncbi:MAG: hypothetical protein E7774_11845, partial [Bradyrhizobium sp.]